MTFANLSEHRTRKTMAALNCVSIEFAEPRKTACVLLCGQFSEINDECPSLGERVFSEQCNFKNSYNNFVSLRAFLKLERVHISA